MVSDSPVSSSVPRGVCLRTVVMSLLLSLAGLLWYGGKYATVDAHTLPTQSYLYESGRDPFGDTQHTPPTSDLSPTIPNDYDLRSFLLSRLRQSVNMALYEKRLTGSKSPIHKRQISDKELVDQLLIILQRLQNQREANTALTMPSLRFR